MRTIRRKAPVSLVLGRRTPMEARVSDHNMLMDGQLLFFNMMMQCQWNESKRRFNNGFGIKKETTTEYQQRIRIVVQLLAEAAAFNPQVGVIGLAEAPIKAEDIACFIAEFAKYPSLQRFAASVRAEMFSAMGVATFFDTTRFDVTQLVGLEHWHPALENRLQEFVLTPKDGSRSFRLVNLHLPFDLAKSADPSTLIRFARTLFQRQQKTPVVVMGDFNIEPTRVAGRLKRIHLYVQPQNNILIKTSPTGEITGFEFDTVDGIAKTASLCRLAKGYVDAETLLWFGTNPLRERSLSRSLFITKIGFFKPRQKERTKTEVALISKFTPAFNC